MCLERTSFAGTTIWSPLASGVLSGKYSKGNVPSDSRLALEAYKVLLCSASFLSQHIFFLIFKHDFFIINHEA